MGLKTLILSERLSKTFEECNKQDIKSSALNLLDGCGGLAAFISTLSKIEEASRKEKNEPAIFAP